MEEYTYGGNNQENQNNNAPKNNNEAGKGQAIASLVTGILSLGFIVKIPAWICFILGIIGIVLASKSKKLGYSGGMRTGGLVCAIIGVCITGIAILLSIFAIGLLASLIPGLALGALTL